MTMVREDELPAPFREGGVSLVRSVLPEGDVRKSPLSERLEELKFKVCPRI